MSVLVFVEVADGEVKGSSLEAVGYGAEVAKQQGTTATAIVLGTSIAADKLAALGKYGAAKVLHVADEKLNNGVIQAYVQVLAQAFEQTGAKILIVAKSSLSDAVTARLSVRLKASLASNVTDLPSTNGGFTVKKSVFTGKAFQTISLANENKIIALKKSAFSPVDSGSPAPVETFSASLSDADFGVKITKTDKITGELLLTEADLVVSGGRGLKGPENWGVILDLAKALNAATGCSKPVSDLDWRPHHEHVGQTGVKVAPNLYVAVGISGAIQHLAGVSSSKCIVVINKDPEAPFFKAADYGIVGDAFEILPKLTAAAQKLK
ncbi:MAG TPA: electron transfer flavoprotein subunit alpha [Microscillaceae bacterium]|jgi:electron transfer flavoprotein alpha subunit|nr:electron transfer flavoprotein subunit alpha [Microscillaceae bacterium]